MCSGKHKHPGTDADEEASVGGADGSATGETGLTFFAAGLQPPMAKPADLMAAAPAAAEPITVYTGPTRTGAALIAAVAADADQQNVRPKGKKARHGAKKADAEATDAGENAKSDAATKPAGAKHANAKPDAAAKSADKSTDKSTDQPAAKKPAKPKSAAKPSATPAPKSSNGDAKPAG
jgi:D-alanyl-D-alanine carboxypeptidase